MVWENSILSDYHWCREITDLEGKRRRGQIVAQMAKDGDVIGVGTGSSSYVGLCCLAEHMKQTGIRVSVIPAASEIRLACAALQIPTTDLLLHRPDWSFDGADEVDQWGNATKGRGGGLYPEKLIIAASPRRYLIAEPHKFVPELGAVPIPVEVTPVALHIAEEGLRKLGAEEVVLRLAKSKDGPMITEAGNITLDCRFAHVAPDLEKQIKSIVGVIESGLFQGYDFSFIRE